MKTRLTCFCFLSKEIETIPICYVHVWKENYNSGKVLKWSKISQSKEHREHSSHIGCPSSAHSMCSLAKHFFGANVSKVVSTGICCGTFCHYAVTKRAEKSTRYTFSHSSFPSLVVCVIWCTACTFCHCGTFCQYVPKGPLVARFVTPSLANTVICLSHPSLCVCARAQVWCFIPGSVLICLTCLFLSITPSFSLSCDRSPSVFGSVIFSSGSVSLFSFCI